MFGIGVPEIILILLVALFIWGGKLPEVAKKASRVYLQVVNELRQIKTDVKEKLDEIKSEIEDTEIKQVKK